MSAAADAPDDRALPALNGERLWARVEALSRLTLPGQPWTRRAFSELFLRSRDWLRAEFAAAGLDARIDAGGNLVGRRAARGGAPTRGALATGSHCDTVPSGGRFDGIIGVLAGLEVAQSFHEAGIELAHPLEVIDFLSEEPSDYGVSCIGSRALAGRLEPAMLAAVDGRGGTLGDGVRAVGGDPARLTGPLREPGAFAAFVELHIEQGPCLERAGVPIGVVTNIVGIVRSRIVVTGRPDHAGTTPMDVRSDALVGAAAIVTEASRHAGALAGRPHHVVATVGRLEVWPNASNAVPGRVEMMLEVRSDAAEAMETFAEAVLDAVADELRALRVTVQCERVSRSTPTDCAPLVIDTIERAAAALELPSLRLPSGAGHDAVYMAALAPVGMVFVPCRGGRSHCPEEWLEPAQLLDGARVLARTLLDLDRRLAQG